MNSRDAAAFESVLKRHPVFLPIDRKYVYIYLYIYIYIYIYSYTLSNVLMTKRITP